MQTNLVDRSGFIDRRCKIARGAKASSFTVTGFGGLPPNPDAPPRSDPLKSNWVSLGSAPKKASSLEMAPSPTTPDRLVEASTWIIEPNGKVILTAQTPTVTSQSNWLPLLESNTP